MVGVGPQDFECRSERQYTVHDNACLGCATRLPKNSSLWLMGCRYSLVYQKAGEIRARDIVLFLRAWGTASTNGLN